MHEHDGVRAVTAIAAIADKVRRDLFHYVRRQQRPTTRDEAAEATGISRKLAAYHLDELVDVGLLRAGYQPSDRRRGRPPKVYQAANTAFAVTIPARRYDLLGEILLDALAAATRAPGTADEDDGPRAHALRAARRRGREVAAQLAAETTGTVGERRNPLNSAYRALERLGFEPRQPAPDVVEPTNCPFHRLAQREPELVCAINREFCAGLFDAVGPAATGDSGVVVETPSHPGGCCVRVRHHPPS
ncbi:MAG TPA: helix-turn-helix domain-containing protein [Pseudonocardiaceae bacterium]